MMQFIGGPLDGQQTSHSPEACPPRLYVRQTGRGCSSWAYMFEAKIGANQESEIPRAEFVASAEDFDPTKMWVYEKLGNEYVLSPMPPEQRNGV